MWHFRFLINFSLHYYCFIPSCEKMTRSKSLICIHSLCSVCSVTFTANRLIHTFASLTLILAERAVTSRLSRHSETAILGRLQVRWKAPLFITDHLTHSVLHQLSKTIKTYSKREQKKLQNFSSKVFERARRITSATTRPSFAQWIFSRALSCGPIGEYQSPDKNTALGQIQMITLAQCWMNTLATLSVICSTILTTSASARQIRFCHWAAKECTVRYHRGDQSERGS